MVTYNKKVEELKNFFQHKESPDLSKLLSQITHATGKTSFLVFKNQKYTTIQTADVAFFYISNEMTFAMCFNGQQFPLTQTLTQITDLVSSKQFFRVNRQYLLNFKAIKEVEHYFMRKLYISLVIESPDKLFINKEKAHSFFAWMEDR